MSHDLANMITERAFRPTEAPLDASGAAALETLRRSTLAAFAFLVWDICITFADEVEHVWTQPIHSITKWSFLVGRYWTLFVTSAIVLSGPGPGRGGGLKYMYPPYCIHWYTFQVVSLQIVIICQQSIFLVRVYALYAGSRVLMWILGVLFVIQHVGIAVSDALAVPQVKFNHVCQSTFAPPGVAGVGAAPLVYDLILLVLTSIKCYQAIFCQSTRARNSLWHTILRDGVLSFLAVCATFGLNGIFYLGINGPLSATAWTWQFSICAVAPGRIVLSMLKRRESLKSSHGKHTPNIPHGRSGSQPRNSTRLDHGTGNGDYDDTTGKDEDFALSTFVPGMSTMDDENRP